MRHLQAIHDELLVGAFLETQPLRRNGVHQRLDLAARAPGTHAARDDLVRVYDEENLVGVASRIPRRLDHGLVQALLGPARGCALLSVCVHACMRVRGIDTGRFAEGARPRHCTPVSLTNLGAMIPGVSMYTTCVPPSIAMPVMACLVVCRL